MMTTKHSTLKIAWLLILLVTPLQNVVVILMYNLVFVHMTYLSLTKV